MRFFGYIIFFFNSCIAFTQKNDTLHFIWTNDTINGKLVEKTAMFLPVTLKSNKKTCFFQFDTGAEDSYLYTADTTSFLDVGINAYTSELESTPLAISFALKFTSGIFTICALLTRTENAKARRV